MSGRLLCRVVELAVIFVLMPIAYRLDLLPPSPILLLLAIGIYCMVVLWRDKSFDRRNLWRVSALRVQLKHMLLLYLFGIIVLALGTWLLAPELLFAFVQENPVAWLMVMLLYPPLSALPQELIYRTFFFHRYELVLRSHWMLVAVSALAFGYAHIIFENTLSVVLSTIGGAIFARRYDESQSLLVVALEHSLYGCAVFTIGLGRYFEHGAV